MATNITKTSHFTAGAGNPISFSQIRAAYGGGTENIKASTYLRNTDDDVDWRDASTITKRVPDATENASVSANNNWTVDSLRDTISQYVVTQSGTDTELSYSANNTGTWNNNLSKNVRKIFDVTGIVHADNVNDDALAFSGNLYNLEIEVDSGGAIYGESGNVGGAGGDALYVNNTYSKRSVEVRSYGKIWAGGGGGSSGNDGNPGSGLACYTVGTNTQSNYCSNWYAVNPNGVRSRCRGGGWRRGQGWNQYNATGYHCGNGNTYYCYNYSNFTQTGGGKGTGGNGGQGKGWSNRNTSINLSPHIGNSGNNGNTNSCAVNGNNSTGNKGNPGNSGGDWGQSSSGSAGRAVIKKNAKITYSTDNTVKGTIQNI